MDFLFIIISGKLFLPEGLRRVYSYLSHIKNLELLSNNNQKTRKQKNDFKSLHIHFSLDSSCKGAVDVRDGRAVLSGFRYQRARLLRERGVLEPKCRGKNERPMGDARARSQRRQWEAEGLHVERIPRFLPNGHEWGLLKRIR